jgi:hypothetical protein|tara:strand:- start:66864 stop:67274 length:411 start_codon:yes stop_codon:yes gene_type:complete
MPVIAFNIESIFAEKNKPVTKETKIENNMTIKDISSLTNKTLAKFNFEFATEYQPEIGNLRVNGHLVFRDEDKKIKEILDIWNKTKKIHKDLMNDITNFILVKCNIKALELSQQVNLPPHIKLPMVQLETKKDYIG